MALEGYKGHGVFTYALLQDAPNAEAAIKQSMSDYDLRPTDKSRLIAQPF